MAAYANGIGDDVASGAFTDHYGTFTMPSYIYLDSDEWNAQNKKLINVSEIQATTYVTGETVQYTDREIEINTGKADLTGSSAGIAVKRPDPLADYRFAFFEDSDSFRIGESGLEQAVMTRDDSGSMTNGKYISWLTSGLKGQTSTYGDTDIGAIKTKTDFLTISASLNVDLAISGMKDEDNMVSDSASHLCTQQSIKAYVDSISTLSSLTTVGSLIGGSIGATFGNIDISSSTLSAGASALSTLSVNSQALTMSAPLTVDVAISGIKDEDNMVSDSASHLCTQQSIKAYADSLATLSSLTSVGTLTTGAIDWAGGITITKTSDPLVLKYDATNYQTMNVTATSDLIFTADTGSTINFVANNGNYNLSPASGSNISIGNDSGNSFIQLNSVSGTPYIDFASLGSVDFNARIALTDASNLDFTIANVGFSGNINVDTISEKTADNGVSIDSVTLKDGIVTCSGLISSGDISRTGADLSLTTVTSGDITLEPIGDVRVNSSNLLLDTGKCIGVDGDTDLITLTAGAVALAGNMTLGVNSITSVGNVTIDSSYSLKTALINEAVVDAGVTVDSTLIKDGGVTTINDGYIGSVGASQALKFTATRVEAGVDVQFPTGKYIDLTDTQASGASQATMGNAPNNAANTGWIKIKIAGSLKYIPYWD